MKISLQWLGRYVNLDGVSVAEITDALPMLGLEVESVAAHGLPALPNVVVGEILSFEKHPNADKLSVCQVATGGAAPRQIVCGAKNFKQGDRVPVALPGAVLPGGFEIKVSKLRDVESCGMMCSARELGIGDDHGGLLILTPRNLPVGSALNDHFPPPDTVFDLAITANRGDALSHIGVARDLAAWFGRELRVPDSGLPTLDGAAGAAAAGAAAGNASDAPLVSVSVTSRTCPYYTARSIRGVKIAPSPEWLRRDLEAVGLRPINNVVDITNWVMLETGQPLHAFDAAKIAGATLNIRDAAAGESILLLDGKTVALAPDDCVIADAAKPLVIAGIMGGEDCGVTGDTRDIVLEAAWFDPAAVRRTSRRAAVSTDSSQRFTRDVDPGATDAASRRAAALIAELAGGTIVPGATVVGAPPRAARRIAITGDYVRDRLGVSTTAAGDAEIASVFTRLGFEVKTVGSGNWEVTVPTFRADIERPIDLVEEFTRVHGTGDIAPAPIASPTHTADDAPVTHYTRRAAARLAGRGAAECVHYTLADGKRLARHYGAPLADALALANPLASDQSHVRPSLLPGLLDALRLNLANHNAPRRLFEVGRVFRPGRDGSLRELVAAAFVTLAEPAAPSWKKREPADFYQAKKLALELAADAGIVPARLVWSAEPVPPLFQAGHAGAAKDRAGNAEIFAGLVDARAAAEWDIKHTVVAGEILLTLDNFAAAPKRPRFAEWSPFPPVTRDVALVVDAALTAADAREKVRGAAAKAAGKLFALESVTCFDVYSGAGLGEDAAGNARKGLGYTLTFRAADRTLTDDEVNKVFAQILATLEKTPGIAIRR